MKKYECEMCNDTGWYGDNGPGIKGNKEYNPCECRTNGQRRIDIFDHKVEMRMRLVKIHEALSNALGDTDPNTDGMGDEEIRNEEPIFWAAVEIAKLIGPEPWR